MVSGAGWGEGLQKQQLYKIKINYIEFELKFVTVIIREIKAELKELCKDRGNNNDEDNPKMDLKQT